MKTARRPSFRWTPEQLAFLLARASLATRQLVAEFRAAFGVSSITDQAIKARRYQALRLARRRLASRLTATLAFRAASAR